MGGSSEVVSTIIERLPIEILVLFLLLIFAIVFIVIFLVFIRRSGPVKKFKLIPPEIEFQDSIYMGGGDLKNI
jgi:hypothetical protein